MKATNRFVPFTALLTLACAGPEPTPDTAERQRSVAEVGATVMPFDLENSTHVFTKNTSGGLQKVMSDSNNPDQISLIRQHLSQEATKFSQGDFHDPEMIHGGDMAGLHELVTGFEQVSFEYSEIASGAQILYTSKEPSLVTAIHSWFDAQLEDHGDHARPH